ncbi:membrane associated protein [Bifidobacterium italicum]|uniref:Membrane associated protein n=1 Tax=Bifidobacterium italicum TaxID=1960968 RepID=A0A2A2EKE8_9BIFI|nr:membrane associated protein [Bifidobacterium italicum]
MYGRDGRPHSTDGVMRRLARRCAASTLALVLAAAGAIAPAALADDPSPSPSPSTSTSQASDGAAADVDPNGGYILDTQNLLGNDIAKVSDAITRTREQTGVQVRLIYVDSFNSTDSPDEWARQTLRSLDPGPNTVLLAVATNDGNLAVVVSPGSDEWLGSQKSVDALSEAASAPLTGVKAGESPDWARSAIDMMDVIAKEKDTATSRSAVSIGVVALVGVVALAAVAVGVVIVVRRRREVDSDAEKDVRDEGPTPDDDESAVAADAADAADAAESTDAADAADTQAVTAVDPHAKYKG